MTHDSATASASDLAAIQQAAMDYAQGWYEGDAERMARALSPEMVKRAFLRAPGTSALRFHHLDKQGMVEKTRQVGGSDMPSDKRTYEVTVLDVYGEIACARAETVEYVDYLQLARVERRWEIVNVLWPLKSAE